MDIDYIPRRLMRARNEILQIHPQERKRGATGYRTADRGGLWQKFAEGRNKKQP